MNPTTLYLTVGGSHQPLVTAIQSLRPQRVVFFCTDRDPATDQPGSRTQVEGKGLCIKAQPSDDKPSLPNIPTQCGLSGEQVDTRIVPSDDFDLAYQAMIEALNDPRYAATPRVADYTGGTKTMTAALVVAVLDTPGVELRLVAGTRADLIKTRDGTQESIPAAVEQVRFRRELNLHLSHWATHNYAAAAHGITGMPAPASGQLRAQRQRALALSKALEAWDRFDHRAAWALIEPYRPVIGQAMSQHITALNTLAGGTGGNAAALRLWDLLLNAERRALARRYDDATARVYRLLEWTAQWLLATAKGWRTADLPESVAVAAGIGAGPNGRYQTGLRGAWELVASNVAGVAANFFRDEGERMLHHLLKRNQSILAHGSDPLSDEDWRALWDWTQSRFKPVLENLLTDAGVRQPFGQLPQRYPSDST
jgi:CRISPR-associated protein (TIGR02710 family)